MEDSIKKVLVKYEKISELVLKQKIDEMTDRVDELPDTIDEVSVEEYLLNAALTESMEQMAVMEDEEEDLLDGMSMREYFAGLILDELIEILEYCGSSMDGKPPRCLFDTILDKVEINDDEYQRLLNYARTTTEKAAWVETELDDPDDVFEIDFVKVKTCLDLLIELKDGSLVTYCVDRFLSYPQTREFVAEGITSYLMAFSELSVPYIIGKLEADEANGLEGPYEDLVIILTRIGVKSPSEDIYMALKHAFRYMDNKIYAVICIADYGDSRAIPMLKGYVNRNRDIITRDLFYEIMSAVQTLGGDISDIDDPFGDFDGKKSADGGAKVNYRE